MTSGRWADLLAQSIVHAFVAALAAEALIRLWRARSPNERLALRLIALAQPLFLSPLLVLAWPARGEDAFRDRWALFTARRWDEVQLLGAIPLFDLWLALLAAAGVALFAMDLVPLLRGRRRPAEAEVAPPPELVAAVARVSATLGVAAPPLRFLDSAAPVLFCHGALRPDVVVSRGALALLDDEELHAALAHEVAHVAHRDTAASWAVMGVRALLAFNPVAQVLARALARAAELRADERALAAADRLALASAILKLFKATQGRPAAPLRRTPLAAALADPLHRAHTLDVERRCRRLLDGGAVPRLAFSRTRIALAAAGLTGLLVVVA